MKLADAQIRLPESDRHGQLIFDAVRESMTPFRMREIYVWMDFDIDANEYIIAVSTRYGSHSGDEIRTRVNASKLAGYPDEEMARIAHLFFLSFRQMTSWTVGDNIILGEN